jgi:hypothetical protein
MNLPFLSGEEIELGKEYTMTVESIGEAEVFDQQTKKKEQKIVIYFAGTKKGMILTKVKAKAITFCMGSGTLNQWIGKKLTLFSKMEKHFGQEMPVINIKLIRNENK